MYLITYVLWGLKTYTIEKEFNFEDSSVEINDQLLKINETLQETDNPTLLTGMIVFDVTKIDIR